MTKKFAGLAVTSLATMFALYGCGSDSSSNANNDSEKEGSKGETSEVESFDDLPKCTTKSQGNIVTVTEDEADYYCYATKWIETVASAKKLPDCTAKKEGDMVFISGSEEVAVCQDEEWITAGTEEDDGKSSASKDDGKSSASKDDGKSSASKDDGKSSASKDDTPKEKVVEFADGVIWQPSYGKRAYVDDEGLDEYNFLDEDETGPGWWYKFVDNEDNGKSTAVGKFSDSYLTLTFNLVYQNWSQEMWSNGDEYGYYYAPNPYPYAGFGFDLKRDQETMNLSTFSEGICITYTSTTRAKIDIASKATDSHGVTYSYDLSSTTTPTQKKLLWTNFTQPSYASEQGAVVARTTALSKAYALRIMYTNDQSGVTDYCTSLSSCQSYASSYGSSEFHVYRIERYDGISCGGSSEDLL